MSGKRAGRVRPPGAEIFLRQTFDGERAAPGYAAPFMGDKSPKATQKQASQKQAKNNSATQKKNAATAAKSVPKAPGKK